MLQPKGKGQRRKLEAMSPDDLVALKKKNSASSWAWRTRFIGQTMQHNYYVHAIVSHGLTANEFGSVVEIGTGRGGLTMVLGLGAALQGIPIVTVDFDPALAEPVLPVLEKLGVEVINGDQWSDETVSRILEVIGDKPTYFVCDGGNKVRELNFWYDKLPPGSLISVHDWLVEVPESAVPKEGLKPYESQLWMRLNAQFATWQVLGSPTS